MKWILLPRNLRSSFLDPSTINGIRVFRFAGEGNVLCGQFDGEANVQSFCLPPHARLEIAGLSFSLFVPFEANEVCVVPYAIADDVWINGEAAQQWFGSAPLCDGKAAVSAAGAEAIFSRYTPDRSEVSLETSGTQLYTTSLRLGR